MSVSSPFSSKSLITTPPPPSLVIGLNSKIVSSPGNNSPSKHSIYSWLNPIISHSIQKLVIGVLPVFSNQAIASYQARVSLQLRQ